MPAVPLLGQSVSWTTADRRVTIHFPESWSRRTGEAAGRTKYYSPTARQAIPQSQFKRRGGGFVPGRNLTAQVYLITQEPYNDEQFLQLVGRINAQMSEGYQVIDRYELSSRGIYSISYRFTHSGDPVTQTVVLFRDSLGRVHFLEVTGHRKDEGLLLGDGRQLVHSIILR